MTRATGPRGKKFASIVGQCFGDRVRAKFLREHIAAIRDAGRLGTDIHGYLHWSLVDNYEWLDGFEPRFGFVEVDRATMQRRPRPSAEIFRELGQKFLQRE